MSGPGGISMLLGIAIPMVISNAAETIMMFVDRMFLASFGREHLAAAMSGGLTVFMLTTFFFGILGYVNALTAQYFGSGQKKQCGVAVAQGFIVAVLSYPIMLASVPLACRLLGLAGHDPLQHELESTYLTILSFGTIMALLRAALSGFFTGIGRTRIVMVSSILAMLLNIPANYVLIFGHLGFPAMGIRGAAYGTLFGSAVALIVMIAAYVMPKVRCEFNTLGGLRLDVDMLRRLLRFGLPGGVEFFLNIAAFNLFVQLFHSYGTDAAAAITITFNWDLVAFLPMMGFNMGVMSLVGRYLGAGDPTTAARVAHSGLKIATLYGLIMAILFVGFPEMLVSFFTRTGDAGEYTNAIPLAVITLRLAAAYTLVSGVLVVFDGALRGGGDTRWTMWASVILHWLMAGSCAFLIKVACVPPVLAWGTFITLVFALAITLGLRFRTGKWQHFAVIGSPSRLPTTGRGPAPPDTL